MVTRTPLVTPKAGAFMLSPIDPPIVQKKLCSGSSSPGDRTMVPTRRRQIEVVEYEINDPRGTKVTAGKASSTLSAVPGVRWN